MRKISLNEIEAIIEENRKMANETIHKHLTSSRRRKRNRTRSPGEIEALNQIAKSRWDKAVETGKIIKLGDRRLYYDYTE